MVRLTTRMVSKDRMAPMVNLGDVVLTNVIRNKMRMETRQEDST